MIESFETEVLESSAYKSSSQGKPTTNNLVQNIIELSKGIQQDLLL